LKETALPVNPTYRPARAIEELAEGFFDKVEAAPFPETILRHRNQRWAERVGLDGLTEAEWLHHFGRFEALPDNLPQPLALRYHGHQFRSYNPDLGDGRGFLFAQMFDNADNRLLDLGTKGSGRTPWSRQGDGRLTLKGGVREVLATALLEALGVNTSKSFSLIETGEKLYRGDEPSPTRSSVLVRLSHSHIRIGTFQRHAFHGDEARIWQLLRYCVRHYMPDLAGLDDAALPAAFLKRVTENVAATGSQWMAAGFVHGVLNTDNINITGESFDYGPYRFLPYLDPGFTAAYFDTSGLYAFGRQLEALAWNLDKLGGTLTLISEREPLIEALETFTPAVDMELRKAYLSRLGLKPMGPEADDNMLRSMNRFLADAQVGYDQFFFDWHGGKISEPRARQSPEAEKYTGVAFDEFYATLAPYQASHPARLETDYFKAPRPCSLLIDEIETLWTAIAENDDWSLFEAKLAKIEEMRKVLERAAR
jgi:uncharacterized protein YdiU (UPF0061 family)